MTVLNLTIRRKWYDLICTGEKKEEYRTEHNKAALRFFKAVSRNGWHLPDHSTAIFRNGYNMGSAAVAVEIVGVSLRRGDEAQHPEWGEATDHYVHFVIKLGAVVAHGTYADVKRTCTMMDIDNRLKIYTQEAGW